MITSFDYFNQKELPYIVLTNPNKEQLYSLGGVIYETKLIKRFNAISEFSFKIPFTTDNGDSIVESYEYVQQKRYILIEGEGYYIISSAEEDTDGAYPVKNVVAKSVEAEMLSKKFVGLKGTYKFYNFIPVINQVTILDKVLEYLPTWTIGSIDVTIASKYRTFDVSDTTIYGFLINDCEKAFECIFIFDIINKTISVSSVTNATTTTDIYLSYDNLIKNSSLKEIGDEIATVLYVYGSGDLSIGLVNPLGTNAIYNFTYYKTIKWMTQGLIDAITAWEIAIAANQVTYAGLLTDLRVKNFEILQLESEYDELQIQYTVKETEQKALIQAGQPISAVNNELLAIKVSMDLKQTEINSKQAEIDVVVASLTGIATSLSFDNNFTTEQYKELSTFMFENTYQNSNLVVTDLTTPNEYQATAQELYDQAISVLSRSSLPRYEFSMETANLVALKEFESFTQQLNLGSTVTVNVNDQYLITPVLLEIEISYDRPDNFSLTFSNRLRLDNGNFQYADLVGNVVSTGSSVSGNSQQWGNWNSEYKDEVSRFIVSSLDASKNSVINATNQEITIGANGLRGRTLLDTGLYDNRQVWMTSNLICFTKDNWDTSSLALGEVNLGGNQLFGIVAEAIVGNLIAGNQLYITTEDSSFTVDGQGARLYNAPFVVQSDKISISMSPEATTLNNVSVQPGITIQSKASGTWENVFYSDVEGNLVMKGGVTATFGNLGGWIIDSKGLRDGRGNYIYSDGTMKLGGLTIAPGTASFTGDIYATRFYGKVVDASNIKNNQIGNQHISLAGINADFITTGTLQADNILFKGKIRGEDGFEISMGKTGISYMKSNSFLALGVGSHYLSNPAVYLKPNPKNPLGNHVTIGGTGYSVQNSIQLNGITELHDIVRVTSGGTGVTKDYIVTNAEGTQENLHFVNGILCDGAQLPFSL